MKTITISLKQLKQLKACQDGQNWFKKHKIKKLSPLIRALDADNKANYGCWLLAHLLTHPQQVMWAVFSAEQVLNAFESKFPNDLRPRNAIQAAKDFLSGRGSTNAAYAAAYDADAAYAAANAAAYTAAYAAAYAAAYDANAAANAAAYTAAYAAAYAAAYDADAAYAAAYAAAYDAAKAAAYTAADAATNNAANAAAHAAGNRTRMTKAILNYALKLLGQDEI